MPRRPCPTLLFGFVQLGLAAVLLLTACETPDRQRRLGDFVEELIYGGPFDATVPQENSLRRWAGEIAVRVEGLDSETHRDAILDLTRSIADLAGLSHRPVAEGETANFVVRLTAESDFEVKNEFVDCYMRFEAEEDRLVSAQVFIGMQEAGAPNHCLAHELMHAFGFSNHSAIVRSALSPIHDDVDLTPWDRLALRVLYDRRLEPGMRRSEARPVIDGLITEFLSQT